MEKTSNIFQKIPKVDLHRHLEGSLRISTIVEIAHEHGMEVPTSTTLLSILVQVQKNEPSTHQNFLAKFATLRLFYRSPEVIRRVTREAIEDAACDNVRHLELHFTPVALSQAERFPIGDVMDWVCESSREAAQEYKINVGLIASINRHESVELAEQVACLAGDRMAGGIVGLDLAGNEADYEAKPFTGIFKEAQQAGLHITIHAGEWGSAINVREAIELFEADRIGHGVRVLEDANTVRLARERKVPFEVCITSNLQTGAASPSKVHPVMEMIKNGLNVTLATDDPSISQITLTGEYKRICEEMGLPKKILFERILAAAEAGFLPETEKKSLLENLETGLK